jgi:hypothetical protein
MKIYFTNVSFERSWRFFLKKEIMNNDILDADLPFITKVDRLTRFKSLFFDYLSICFIFPFILLPVMGILWLIEQYTPYGCFLLYLGTYVTLLVHKDALNGMSLGKRKAGLQIIDIDTNKQASNFKCILRNIVGLLFMIEIPILLFRPERRLGDLIVGTKLSFHSTVPLSDTQKELKDYDKKQFIKEFVLVFFAVLLVVYLISFVFPTGKTHISR